MTTAETMTVHNASHTRRESFGEINEPGCYVCNTTGFLYRIPQDGLVGGRSPVIEIVAKAPAMVTRISDDPWLPISKARQLAADIDLYLNF